MTSTLGQPSPKRLLITGSRRWADAQTVADALRFAWHSWGSPEDAVLISGACPRGADLMAESEWALMGLAVERHLPDWDRYGRAAGPLRNQAMVDAGADLCLAFIRDGSMGATGCAWLAERARIPVRRLSSARHLVEWYLSESHSPVSPAQWWETPQGELGDATPEQAWELRRGAVLALARSLVD